MKKRKRIALVYKDLSLGGVQKKIVDISNELISRKDVEVYLFLTQKKGEFLKKITSGVNIVDLHGSSKLPFVVFLPLKLWFNFLKYRPHVVYAMMDTYGCASVLAGKISGDRKPRIIISQNVLASRFFEQRPFTKFRRWLVRKLYPEADCIVSLSEAITSDLNEKFGIPKRKIILMRNWLESPLSREERNRENKDIDILYAGRFAPEKNLSLLLDAFRILVRKRPHATLCLLGYGECEKEIRKKMENLRLEHNVKMPGFTHNVRRYLRRAKMLTLSSSNEGTPMVMLEAMATGVPVISTGFPGVHEVITHKKSGIIVKSAKDMAQWMDQLLWDDQLRKKITCGAFMIIKKRYPARNLYKLIEFVCRYA